MGKARRGKISTHAPLAGRDPRSRCPFSSSYEFQPTRPLRGATAENAEKLLARMIFQPTRPLRGATDADDLARAELRISTHAPLAGRDRRG